MIATPAYFAARGAPRNPADLLMHDAIVYEQRDGGATWAFRQGTSETAVIVNGRLRVNASEGVREAVFADLGIAISSEWLFGPELKSGVVVSVLQDWLLPPVDLWAVFPEGRQASAKARAFARFVQLEVSNSNSVAKERASDASLWVPDLPMGGVRRERKSGGGVDCNDLAVAAQDTSPSVVVTTH